jgi:predicted GIY-YIG superfamily endonuclease
MTVYYTYILRSLKQDKVIYVGHTVDLKRRLLEHNNLKYKSYSKRFSPWKVESYFAFSKLSTAKDFEKYLKSSSGKAFMRKRLASPEIFI